MGDVPVGDAAKVAPPAAVPAFPVGAHGSPVMMSASTAAKMFGEEPTRTLGEPVKGPTQPPTPPTDTPPKAAKPDDGDGKKKRKLNYGAVPWPCQEALDVLRANGSMWNEPNGFEYKPASAFGKDAAGATIYGDETRIFPDFQMLIRGFAKRFGLSELGVGALLGISPWQSEVLVLGVSEKYATARRKDTPGVADDREAVGEIIRVDRDVLCDNVARLFREPLYWAVDLVAGRPRQGWSRANSLVHSCVARCVSEYGYGPLDYEKDCAFVPGGAAEADHLAHPPDGYTKLPIVATPRANMRTPEVRSAMAIRLAAAVQKATGAVIAGNQAAGRAVADALIARLLASPGVVRRTALAEMERECTRLWGHSADAVGYLEDVAAFDPRLGAVLDTVLGEAVKLPVTVSAFTDVCVAGARNFVDTYNAITAGP